MQFLDFDFELIEFNQSYYSPFTGSFSDTNFSTLDINLDYSDMNKEKKKESFLKLITQKPWEASQAILDTEHDSGSHRIQLGRFLYLV